MLIIMRINARLDHSYEEKFVEVQQRTLKTRTEILKDALDLYFQAKLEQDEQQALANNRKILELVGGIAEGPEGLSENYKEMIDEGLKGKYDLD